MVAVGAAVLLDSVEGVVVAVDCAVVAGVDSAVLALFELPHPPNASAPTSKASSGNVESTPTLRTV